MKKKNNSKASSLKVIPIGGLNEIGKNMTLLECNGQILIIDCGMTFPDDEMLGIDVVIPDFTYLIQNRDKIVGMVLTHGHEDHIGAIPYFLRDIKTPIYGTRFTLGLVDLKLKEHNVLGDLRTISAGETFEVGCFSIEAIRTTHSIADSLCLAITTPQGLVFHSGDFKVDYTPVDGEAIDLAKLAEIGRRGVKLMLCESTNALRPGFTKSEAYVGETIEDLFQNIERKRIIIATFSSNVHRVQKIIESAVKCGRKVAISGRSMENAIGLAIELGYLDIPDGTLVDLTMIKNIPDDKLVIITTGSQGEPMSALSRIAAGEHKAIKLKQNDVVILSSSPIPGNEKNVSDVVNKLFERGAEVIYSEVMDVHVSGHACQEELKLLHSLIKPKFFMPVHGEYRHLAQHARIAETLGMDENDIFVLRNGDTLTVYGEYATLKRSEVDAEAILVDGLGVGDIGNIVLRDRKLLAQSGLVMVVAAIDSASGMVVSGPEIISRGFIYVRENEELIEAAREVCMDTFVDCYAKGISDWNALKSKVKDALSDFIYETTKRTPIILPIFLEV